MAEHGAVTWVAQGEAAEIAEYDDCLHPLYRPIHVVEHRSHEQRSFNSSWLSEAVAAGPQQFDIDVLTRVVTELEVAMNAGSFDLISGLLRKLPLNDLSPQVMITVLRVTSSAKNHIPRWVTVRDAARTTIAARGLNAERMLRGL